MLRRFFFSRIDGLLLIAVFLLIAIGLAAIYSVDLSRGGLTFFPTQLLSTGIGVVVLIITLMTHPIRFERSGPAVYWFGIVLLIGVLFWGETIRGTTGWFRAFGFSFQPVEFAKVGLLLFLSTWIYRYNRRFHSWQFFVSTAGIVSLPAVLVFLQPDLGSGLILLGTWATVLIAMGTKRFYLLLLAGTLISLTIVAWFFFLKPYQKDRILTFLGKEQSESYYLLEGYNVRQSIIAIGSGKFTGRGLGFGSQSQLHFLPEAQTDFIFAVIGEELGFIGAFFLLSIYAFVIVRLILHSHAAKDDFAAALLFGIAMLFTIQVVVNVGGTMGVLPVTGITLPFVSYGGSSLIMNLLLMGIAISVIRGRTADPY